LVELNSVIIGLSGKRRQRGHPVQATRRARLKSASDIYAFDGQGPI
jgi:hypothetical protein